MRTFHILNLILGLLLSSFLFCSGQESAKKTGEKEKNEEEIYTTVEKMPEFPGGEEKMMSFIRDNIKVPPLQRESPLPGRVFVKFVVDKNGNIVDPVIIRQGNDAVDEEVLRMIRSMPQWTPGSQNGKPVSVLYNLPITICIK